jgi:hypothetical protein
MELSTTELKWKISTLLVNKLICLVYAGVTKKFTYLIFDISVYPASAQYHILPGLYDMQTVKVTEVFKYCW